MYEGMVRSPTHGVGRALAPTRRRVLSTVIVVALCLSAFACTSQDDPTDGSETSGETDGRRSSSNRGWLETACSLPPSTLRIVERGTVADRSPDVVFLPQRPNFIGGFDYTSHSGAENFLQRVPLVFYGPGFIPARGELELQREVTVADIAPTIADLIGTPFPRNRSGRVIREALLPADERAGKPALVVVVVWDGGGINVLERWPEAWPHLKELTRNGTSVTNTIVGSSPSVTPAVHATIGTGSFPEDHLLVDTRLRVDGEVVDAWEDISPSLLRQPTLADLYDRAAGNVPLVGLVSEHPWHFGMMGRGASFPAGDNDIAVAFSAQGKSITNPSIYSLPASGVAVPGLEDAIRDLDSEDGAIDSRWMGGELEGNAKGTPAWTTYQTRVIESVITAEGFGQDEVPDLFFTNYKQLDLVGHKFNMTNPEVRLALEYTDAQLPDLTALLNRTVGPNRWVMAITADHGQQPDAESLDAWPIGVQELAEDLAEHLGVERDDLVEGTRVTGLWLDREVLSGAGATLGDAADFMLDYTIEDNASDDVPADYSSRRDERLIRAAMPASRVADVLDCSQKASD